MNTPTKRTERDEATVDLRVLIQPGEIVYTKLCHVARSSMYRVVDLYVMRENEPRRITWSACKALGLPYDCKHEGMALSGCGMDMGFFAVYELACTLFPDGHGCIGEGCPSNDHRNGDRDYTPHGAPLAGRCPLCCKDDPCVHGGKVQHMHRDGGYALRQRWL